MFKKLQNKGLGNINNAKIIAKFKGLSETTQVQVNFAEMLLPQIIKREQQQAHL